MPPVPTPHAANEAALDAPCVERRADDALSRRDLFRLRLRLHEIPLREGPLGPYLARRLPSRPDGELRRLRDVGPAARQAHHQQSRLQGRQDPGRPGRGGHKADSSDRRFIHRGRRAGVRADVRRHAVSGRTKACRENRIPQRRRDLLFPHHLLQEDQVSARRGPQVRRGRGVVGPVRRAGRGDRLFLHRRACGIPAVLHRASLQLDRQTHAHPGPRPPRAAESRSEVQGQLRHDGPAAADVLA